MNYGALVAIVLVSYPVVIYMLEVAATFIYLVLFIFIRNYFHANQSIVQYRTEVDPIAHLY